MSKYGGAVTSLSQNLRGFVTRCMFAVLSVGSIPDHLAFILDGNRRYAKKHNLEEGAGHSAGFMALMSILGYCYELGVKYVTLYVFSIDNFKRGPHEVQYLMDLMLEKLEAFLTEESIMNEHGIRVYFSGNLKLLSEPLRNAMEKVMTATANNSTCVLVVCAAYTSTDEIVHAVEKSCQNKCEEIKASNANKGCKIKNEVDKVERKNSKFTNVVEEVCKIELNESKESVDCHSVTGAEEIRKNGVAASAIQVSCEDKGEKGQVLRACSIRSGVIPGVEESKNIERDCPAIKLVDIEKHMYMAIAPDPDILFRTSGETRLSNFLLWQATNCLLYSPAALWPEIGLRHLMWAILNFQRNHYYLEKKKKQL